MLRKGLNEFFLSRYYIFCLKPFIINLVTAIISRPFQVNLSFLKHYEEIHAFSACSFLLFFCSQVLKREIIKAIAKIRPLCIMLLR